MYVCYNFTIAIYLKYERVLNLCLQFLFQESLMHEMWEEFKFAVNWSAGDTKPIKTGSQSRVGSRSLLSKSNAESINKYGVILDDDKSRKDSTYATFNGNVYGEKKWSFSRSHVEIIKSISIVFLGIFFCQTFVTFCCNKPAEEENSIIYKGNPPARP